MLAGQALASKGLEPLASIRLADVSLQEPNKYKVVTYQGNTAGGLPRYVLPPSLPPSLLSLFVK